MQYSPNKDHQHLKWQPPRSWISSPDCRVAMDKSSRCSIGLYPSKIGRCSQIIEKSQIGMPLYLDTSTENTNGQHHGPVSKTQLFFFSGICTVILWQDYFWEKQFEKIVLQHGWEKFYKLWMFICQPRKKGPFLSVYVDEISGWEKAEQQSDVEHSHERRCSGRTNIIPRQWLFGLYSKRMLNQQGYCG